MQKLDSQPSINKKLNSLMRAPDMSQSGSRRNPFEGAPMPLLLTANFHWDQHPISTGLQWKPL